MSPRGEPGAKRKKRSRPAQGPGAPLDGAARRIKRRLLAREVVPVDVRACRGLADLVEGMKDMSIQARNVGLCASVLDRMMTDRARPTVFLGLAGPLIAAGLRTAIRDLVAGGYVDVVVSTGAIIYQDIYQARGHRHWRGTPQADDTALRALYIDRIYDTFCPALNDSSIGIGLTHHRHRCRTEKRPGVAIDSIQDNYELTQIVAQSKKTAAIYVAGGVPKNYINDSIVMASIFGVGRGHAYAVQVTTAVTADGGLSSSTLGEAQSWGKIRTDAACAMAWVEPSVALPLLAGYLFDRYPAPARRALRLEWRGDALLSMG